jgi:WD40 repeat protein/nucleoside phosphorylase/uncharacterized protein YjbI with pentapeptide repeats
MSLNVTLFGDSLREAAKPWLEELGKSDRDRLLRLLKLTVAEKTRLSDVLNTLFYGEDTQTALANLTRLRNRLNEVGEALGLSFKVDTKKKSPPEERAVWFTGPDKQEAELIEAGRASVRNLDRLPSFIDQQLGFVYNPAVDERTKVLDFAVLIALQEEFEQVYGSIIPMGEPLPVGQETAYVFTAQGYTGCIACVGKMGPAAMADLSRSILERFKPRLICVIGIAGGLEKSLRLGDVLVADQADDYLHTAKAVSSGDDGFDFQLSGEAFPTHSACIATLRNWSNTAKAAFEKWQQEGGRELDAATVPENLRSQVGFRPSIAIGHIATGNVVGASAEFTRMLQRRDRKLAALEMESSGMLSAVHKHRPETMTLVLRGISDFADERKSDFDGIGHGQFRRAAMRNATRLLLASLPSLLRGKPIAASDSASAADLAHSASLQQSVLPHAYIPNDSCPVGVGEVVASSPQVAKQGRVPAADYILEWVRSGDSPFLAVLGEYGIGKTTTLKHVTRRLLEERANDPSLPLPIFIDLRENYLSYKAGSPLPTLEEIIAESMRRNWKMETQSSVSSTEILKLVRQQNAVIIFDGLDEKIVHMDSKMAQGFIRELWRALPPYNRDQPCRGRLVLSCRSHYFPTITSQRSLLCGEDRENIRENDYRACLILPFSQEQIQAYLRGSLGEEKGAQAWQVITSIHNLEDLSTRPYLLGLITGQIETLELRRARGEAVTAATLYDGMVQEWLQRDGGKHKFSEAHKRELMEHLAADFWREGVKEWPWSRVERWLENFYASHLVWQARYNGKCDFELLLEDLRTATFIVRPETSPDHFRFAHTSLQEYFLASHLSRALADKADAEWDMPMVSLETLDFLGQILATNPSSVAIASLERILGGSCLSAACLAFRYWLEAIKRGHPEPQPQHVNLAGADLEEWHIQGRSKDRPLNLRGANLRRVQLNRARVEFVDLADSDLFGMEARQALFLQVNAARAKMVQVDLAGLDWRGGSLMGAAVEREVQEVAELLRVEIPMVNFSPAPRASRAHALSKVYTGHRAGVTACAWNPRGTACLSGSVDGTLKLWDAASGRELLTLAGHASSVSCCAWSPDGSRLLSGSLDNTLKLWDAASGRELLSLTGHAGYVYCCAWSPDGSRLLSGSEDTTLKLWDAASGRELISLSGHARYVRCCAWSPDGSRLLSGSTDKTLKLWDAASGRELLSLTGHARSVSCCSWSPDGSRLLSGSDNHTLKLWDAASGRELLSLSGHALSVRCCAWSPDGSRLLSDSGDNTLKLWDAAADRELLSLSGHAGDVSCCAWSPDGSRLLSGSDDNTLKLWDAASGRELLSLRGHASSVRCCAWSPDGSRLLSGSDDKTLKLWDAASGRELLSLSGHASSVRCCAWSPDGSRLLSGSTDKTLKLWDAASGRELLSLTGHTNWVLCCAWSPDGSRLLSGSEDNTLKLWDAASGRELLSLTGHARSVDCCAWSPDGSRLLSGSEDNTLKLWDASFGRELLSFTAHASFVRCCAWSPDGSRLLSGSDDNTLKLWDAATGECLWTGHHLPEHQSAVIDGTGTQILHATPEAWRWLGWEERDAKGRFIRRLPAEVFGPIPGMED